MKQNNSIVVDLDKISYAEFNYVCHSLGRTYKRKKKPDKPTVNGMEFECEEIRKGIIELHHPNNSWINEFDETMLDYAKRRNLLDHWYSELTLQIRAGESLVFIGHKARVLWKTWCAKQYNKKGKK